MIVSDRLPAIVLALLVAAFIAATVAGPIGAAFDSFSLVTDTIGAAR